MAEDLVQLAERFLPSYLLPDARRQLLDCINSFPHNRGYYSQIDEPELLQGDGWTNFIAFNFETGDRKPVAALILSNSCDIARANNVAPGQKVVFAPIIRLSRYTAVLRANGRNEQQIGSIVDRLMKQHDGSAFYLPAYDALEDSIVLLDDVHSEPLDFFWAAQKTRLVRLSDFGFWMFVLKLSIHFSRLHEEVQRGG